MAKISDKKREQMNELYFSAIRFRKAQLKFCDMVSEKTLRELLNCGVHINEVLTEINGGKDPVHFIGKVENICATANLLAKESEASHG